jgi:hypothetical protein
MQSLSNISGVKPVVWRSPSWEWSDRTLDYLLETGINFGQFFDRGARIAMCATAPLPLVELPVHGTCRRAPHYTAGRSACRAHRTRSRRVVARGI